MYTDNITQKSITFPNPNVFVGVFTEIKIKSACLIAESTSVVKVKFFPRHCFTTSSNPGYIKI